MTSGAEKALLKHLEHDPQWKSDLEICQKTMHDQAGAPPLIHSSLLNTFGPGLSGAVLSFDMKCAENSKL